jgi:serine protein kinase
MTKKQTTFVDLIKKDRASRDDAHWQGTFLEYLEKIRKNPDTCQLAPARLHDVVAAPGVEDLEVGENGRLQRLFGDEPVRIYNFFKEEFFGVESVISKLVRYLHAAALQSKSCAADSRKPILFMRSPGAQCRRSRCI